MARSIYVPQAGGFVQFKDTATDAEIVSYLKSKYAPQTAAAPAPAEPPPPEGPDESGILGRAAYGFATGFTDVPSGIASLFMPAEEVAKTSAGQFSEGARKYLEETFGIDPTKDPTAAQQAAQILGNVGSFLVPGAGVAKGVALAGKGAKAYTAAGGAADFLAAQRAARIAGTTTAAAQGVALGAAARTQTIQDQLAAGMEISPEQQLASQQLSGLIGVAEAAPIARFFGPLTTLLSKVPVSKAPIVEQILKSRLASITKAGAAEGAQEVASGIANDLVEYGVYNPDVEIGQDLLSNAAGGAFAGSFIEGVIQIAAGRKLRPYRQLEEDLRAESQQNFLDTKRGTVANAAERLRQFNVEGPVELVEEEIDNVPTVTIKTKGGNIVGSLPDIESANQAIDLYQKKTGAKIRVAQPFKGPDIFPIKIAGQSFNSMDDIVATQTALRDQFTATNELLVDPVSVERNAKLKGLSPDVYRKEVQKEAGKMAIKLEKLEQFVRTAAPKPPESVAAEDVGGSIARGVRSRGLQGVADIKVTPGPAIWANRDNDVPVTVLDEPAQTDPKSGAEFRKVKLEDGTEKFVPAAEIVPPRVAEMATERPTEAVSAVEPLTPIGAVEADPAASAGGIGAIVEPETPPPSFEETLASKTGPTPVPVEETAPPPPRVDTAGKQLVGRLPGEPRAVTPKQAIAKVTAPREYTPEQKAYDDKLYGELRKRLDTIATPGVKLELTEMIDTLPGYLVRGNVKKDNTPNGTAVIVELSKGIFDPDKPIDDNVNALLDVLNHEAIHVLRNQLRPIEWQALSRAVQNTKVPGKRYTYLDKAEAIYTPLGLDSEGIIEEAVAEMYKDWVRNRTAPAPTRGPFNRITEFLRRIFRALKSTAYEDVFKSIESGEVRKRDGVAIDRGGTKFAASPIFLRRADGYEEEKIPGSNKRESFVPDAMDASQADKAYRRLNEAIARYPNPMSNSREWTGNLAFAYNQRDDLLMPPSWGISMVNDVNSWANWMKGLTPDQLRGVDSGFASIDAISAQYKSGKTTPEFTGTLLFWTYLSRMASSFPHESGFLDVAESALPFIRKAINGSFTADPGLLGMTATGAGAKASKESSGFAAGTLPADIAVAGRSDLDDWFLMVRRTVPDYSPGNSVTNNMNSFGRDFLTNMAKPAPDGRGSKLSAVHGLFASNMSGPDVRRGFHKVRDGAKLGFDNKILSFAILLSGRKDVLVMDRIQINQLFGGGQTNKIYDDVASVFNGPKGLAIYEALERGLTTKINDLYSAVGRPNDASLGRYHWESWIRSSGQIVAHPTIQGLVNMAQGKPNPFVDIASIEGRYHRGTFGVQYIRRPNGRSEYVYTANNGDEYTVNKDDLDTILKKDYLVRIGAVPPWFPGVADFEGGVVSWRDYPGVDIQKIDNEIARNGTKVGNAKPSQAVNQASLANQAAAAARVARARAVNDAANRARWEFGRRPAGGKPDARIPESYRAADRRDPSGDVINVFTPKDGVKQIFGKANISSPDFLELSPERRNVKRFMDALIGSKNENTYGSAVFVYDADQYADMRLFVTEDDGAGFALKKDGDIVSVFNRKSSPYRAVSIPIIHLAVQLGGRKLDGFDTVLPGLYSQGGMSVVSRTKFADLDGIRPDDWDYNTFSDYNAGRPDVVFMVFDPRNWSVYKPTDGQLFIGDNAEPYAAAEEAYNNAAAVQSRSIYVEPEEKAKPARAKKGTRFSAAPVDPDEFRRWFRNSKAVNPDGTPQRWFHGTPFLFDKFGKPRSGSMEDEEGPFYFSQSPEFVEDYSLRRNYAGGDRGDIESGGRTIPVFLSVQNPFDYQNPQHVAAVVNRVRELHESGKYRLVDPSTRNASEALENSLETLGYDIEDGDWPTIEKKNVQRAIRDLGYDGFFIKENKKKNLAVYSPVQIKSTLNPFEPGTATSEKYSAAPLPAYIENKNDTLFAKHDNVSFPRMIFDFLFKPQADVRTIRTQSHGDIEIKKWTQIGLAGRAAIVDKNAAVTFLEKLLNQKTTGNFERMTADYSATAAMAWRSRSSHLTAAMIRMGRLSINFARPGDIQSATMKIEEDPDNLLNVVKVLMEPGPTDSKTGEQKDKREVFKSYAVAMRAKNKKAAGLPTPNEVDDTYIREAISTAEQSYPEVVEAYKMYQRFNKKLLESAVKAGLIKQTELNNLTREMDYYGFYHEVYDTAAVPGMSTKTASQFKLRPYTGSQYGNLLNDPVAMMIHNSQFWVDSIAKNLAATKAFEVARQMGEARILGTGEDPKEIEGEAQQVMFYKKDGVQMRFAVKDPLLVTALGSDDRIDMGGFMKVLGLPTQWIRESVTRDPGFMVANLLRDTLSSWITSGEDITPFLGTARGFKKALKKEVSFQALMGRGVVGSYDLAMLGPSELASKISNIAAPKNVHVVPNLEMASGAAIALWDRLGALSEASDAATRIAVYESAINQGLSEAEAAFRAIEIMDFSRRGGSAVLGVFTKLIPFLNARIQGLDVLWQAGKAGYRVATGKSVGERDANLGKKFLVRGGMLAALSMVLEMWNSDDEEYENLDDYIKNGNMLIPLDWVGMKGEYLAIPKPFEAGLLFSTFPQQFYKTMAGDASTRENLNLFTTQFASTFGVNFVPQAVLPLAEAWWNIDFYTGLPLISEGKARLAPELQYNTGTSTLSMLLGKIPITYNLTTGKFEGTSPIIIENLIEGYTGPIGSMVVDFTGVLMDLADAGPERMPTDLTKLPVVKRVFIDAEKKNPKVVTQAYELFQIADEANRTFSRLKQIGDVEAVKDYVDENRDILTYRKYIFKMVDGLNKLNAQERRIESDPEMTADEKREAMRKLREMRVNIASKVAEMNEKLGR